MAYYMEIEGERVPVTVTRLREDGTYDYETEGGAGVGCGLSLYDEDGNIAVSEDAYREAMLAKAQETWQTMQAAGLVPTVEERLAAAEGTIQTHDQEIDEIVTGLEALANG